MRNESRKRPISASSKGKKHHKAPQSASLALDATALSFLKIFENTSDVVALTDEKGIYKYVSPSVRTHFGYSPKELIGNRGIFRVHPDDQKNGSRVLKKLLKSTAGASITYELRSRHKDGTWHWYQATSNNLLRTAPIFAVFSIFRDITVRKEDEERLRYFESMSNSISDAVISTDNDHRIVSWNRGAEELYGWKASEVEGRSVGPVLRTVFIEESEKVFWTKLLKTGFWKGEVMQKGKKGEDIAIFASVSMIQDVSGKQTGFVSVNRDIRRRNAHIKALKESEERYKAFISHSTEGICRYEISKPISTSMPVAEQARHLLKYGRVGECNDAMARMYGFTKAGELVGAPITQFLEPDNPEHVKLVYSFIRSGYRLIDAEVKERDKDGNIKYFLLNFIGVVDENGKGSRAWGTKRDITDRKRAENAIKESEERFRIMADQAPVMIWMAGTNKLCYWFNTKWLEYTGKSMGKEIGNGWEEGVHPDDKKRCEKTYSESFDARKPYRMEYRLRRHDGAYHWMLSNGVPLFSSDGTFQGYIGSCIDINEMHIAEQRKDEFIGIASHELKTPITTVKVYLQMLQKMAKSGKTAKIGEHLSKMDSQVDKLTKLISDLLDISKIQAGKLEFNKADFKVDDMVRETLDMMKGVHETHAFKTKLEAKAVAYGDRDRVSQVLINFITNAIKYSPNADKIVISTRVKGSNAIVSVQDFGIGITEEHQRKVFDRFFRVEGIHERTYPGFGMGLYISAELIRRHGGEIWVESVPGKGSTFSFSVPLAKNARKTRPVKK